MNMIQRIEISDHAVVRYMERIQKIDIEAVKEKMLENQHIVNGIWTLQSGKIPVGDKLFYVFKNRKIISVWDETDYKIPFMYNSQKNK